MDQMDKEAHALDEGQLYIVYDDGTLRDILTVSDLILSLKPFWMGRVYSREDVLPEVRQACREFVEQEGAAS